MAKYTLGIDYGTLSVRTILMNCEDGSVAGVSSFAYPHGVMDQYLPDGRTALPVNWALQYPEDYLMGLEQTVRQVMDASGISSEDVIGLAIDFTSCTVVAADREKRPLCSLDEFKEHPHAYAKLWKHHGAQDEADQITQLLRRLGILDQPRYGGAVSPELLLPKILETANDDPAVYEAADAFLEAGDWMTWVLTGERKRSGNMAAYKAMWTPEDGYVPREILTALHPCFENLVTEKLRGEIVPAGSRIGSLTGEWAEKLALKEGIAVGASVIDSHAGLPGSGIHRPGQMMLVLGTSSVQLLLSETPYAGHGVVGGVAGAIMPGYYSLEAGLAAVGDMYGWFADGFCPEKTEKEAAAQGMNRHQYLSAKAAELVPGASGLVALDWWNGNKVPYVNGNLSGVLLGLTLHTKPEEIYRALIEATAFGTRRIMEEFLLSGAEVDEVIVSGGIAEKNPLVLQIFADVLNRPLKISASDQTAALGSAMYAAAAAGKAAGGFENIALAARTLAKLKDTIYTPNPKHTAVYNRLYDIYRNIAGLFNPQTNTSLTALNELKQMR